jgi:hypothetical protein
MVSAAGGDEYFQRHARDLVVKCLSGEFDGLDTKAVPRAEALVPFKTLVVLVEKPDVCSRTCASQNIRRALFSFRVT